ncbi:hypothetical protein BZA77DRAFT_4991 [Pyronema omphalodes]|nr:hypothetical protein BZA77DRAFT_4991 [Pyronema omphalodes]
MRRHMTIVCASLQQNQLLFDWMIHLGSISFREFYQTSFTYPVAFFVSFSLILWFPPIYSYCTTNQENHGKTHNDGTPPHHSVSTSTFSMGYLAYIEPVWSFLQVLSQMQLVCVLPSHLGSRRIRWNWCGVDIP